MFYQTGWAGRLRRTGLNFANQRILFLFFFLEFRSVAVAGIVLYHFENLSVQEGGQAKMRHGTRITLEGCLEKVCRHLASTPTLGLDSGSAMARIHP